MSDNQTKLLYGTRHIAQYLGLNVRQIIHLMNTTTIPTFKIVGKVCARPADLDAWLADCASADKAA